MTEPSGPQHAVEVSNAPVEAKVKAGAAGAAVSGLVLWVLSTYVFAGVVPDPVSALVDVLIPGAVAFVSGYLARHTPRP